LFWQTQRFLAAVHRYKTWIIIFYQF